MKTQQKRSGKAVHCDGYPFFRANEGVKGAFGAAQRNHCDRWREATTEVYET